MKLRIAVVVVLIVAVAGRQRVRAAEAWTKIIPGATAQAALVEMFGEPKQGVHLFFREFMSLLNRQPVAEDCCYFLDYMLEQDLAREGPLGEAWDASVWVGYERVVRGVDWTYHEGYRLHAATHEPRSAITLAQIKAFAGKSEITIKPFKYPNAPDTAGSYSFMVNSRSFTINYSGPDSDIIVEMR
jgi:hypothetical protein